MDLVRGAETFGRYLPSGCPIFFYGWDPVPPPVGSCARQCGWGGTPLGESLKEACQASTKSLTPCLSRYPRALPDSPLTAVFG